MKVNLNDSGHLLFFIIVSPGRAGAFSRDFTTSLAPECRAFSRALKIEQLKAPLIPGPEGAVDTNDWCITTEVEQMMNPVQPFEILCLYHRVIMVIR